jgi:hypothetical protein
MANLTSDTTIITADTTLITADMISQAEQFLDFTIFESPIGLQLTTSFIAIDSTDFPALSVLSWDYDHNPPLSSVQIIPRYARIAVMNMNTASASA